MKNNASAPAPFFVDEEKLANDIAALSAAARKPLGGRLTNKAIVLLLQDATGLRRDHISTILTTLPELEKRYLKPAKKGGK